MTDTVVLNAFKVPKSKVSKETQQVMPQVEKVKAHDNTENVEGLSPSDLKDKCPMCGSHLAVGSGKKEKKPRVKLTQEEKAEREAKKEKAKLELETKKAKKAEKSANAKAREPSSYCCNGNGLPETNS